MHSAPSVTYPVGRCLFAGGLLAALWLAGGAVLAGWHLQAASGPWRQLLGACVWLAAGCWAALAWWRSPRGELAWDGGQWRFDGHEAGAPNVALDLQRRLLVRLVVGGRRLWIWAERDSAPSYWDALRRAVYSRARTAAPQGAQLPLP
jgi:toxin CptA